MNNLKLFPSYTIPGFIVLSGILAIFFKCRDITRQDVFCYLTEYEKLLPYLSIAAIAVAYIIGGSANRLIVRLFKDEEDENEYFGNWISILQHGSQFVNAELSNIYAGVMLYRLLTGATLIGGICITVWLYPEFTRLFLLGNVFLTILFYVIYKLTLSSFKNFEKRSLEEIQKQRTSN